MQRVLCASAIWGSLNRSGRVLFAHRAGNVEQREAGKLADDRKNKTIQNRRKFLFQVCAQGS